jgi:hypothetical protein
MRTRQIGAAAGIIGPFADVTFAAITKGAVVSRNPNLIAIVAADAGLLQRLVIIPFMGWIALFGSKLLANSRVLVR